ncbi:ATP-binding protein [Actinokineospora sp. HUAS TT18]|uniref:ATP-binding protein n=1 Tax=Actinokineospora sp. HUAS TT18 TaxID=3447451 RepID=UPI003F521CA6
MRAWGLRARLVAAFALLSVITAAAVASGIFLQASNNILQQAQDAEARALINRTQAMYPIPRLPPTKGDLDALAGRLSDREHAAVAVYGPSASTGMDAVNIPAELRGAVLRGQVSWQRVDEPGGVSLVVGTQLRVTLPSGRSVPSGIEVYTARSLAPEQLSIDRLATIAWMTGALAFGLAVALAWLAAAGVLRPVRELNQAAQRLGAGELTTRLAVRGSDELAGLAGTFNETAAALERQVGELRRMEADARRFVADVSHELRTPLAAMTAFADVLADEALTGDAGTAARMVSQETHNLTRLVNDLIEISRFDSGAATLVLEELDVAAAVRATLRQRRWADQVETDLPEGITARLDPRRLDVIVANLVGNALKHGAPPVSVRLREDPLWIVLEVADRGAGLPPAVLPQVFDRFYKADTARARSEGSGLGLAIARENARLHRGGELVAENRPDGGAVFTLRLARTGEPR